MKFNLKNVRTAFMKVWEKDTPKKKDQKPAYRCVLILDKDDDADQIDELREKFMEVAAEKFGGEAIAEKWFKKSFMIDEKASCVRDGDERDEVTEDFENKVYINCKSYKQPTIQTSEGETQIKKGEDVEGDPLEGTEIYSGCFVNASIDLWAWNGENGKGIGAGLLGLRFRDDGKAFGGGGEVATDDDLSDDGDRKSGKKAKAKGKDKPKAKAKSKSDDSDDEEKPKDKKKKKDKGEDDGDAPKAKAKKKKKA